MKFLLPTHPESSHSLLGRSFELYRHAWKKVFPLAILLSLTAFLPRILSLLVGQDIYLNLPMYSIQRLWLFLINLAGVVFFVAILWRLHCLLIHKHESLEEDLKIGLIKIPNIFVATLVQSLFMLASVFLISSFTYFVVLNQHLDLSSGTWRTYSAIFFFFVQLAIVIFIFLSFYFYLALIVLENKGVFTSLAKSFWLVWRNWWKTVYVQSIPWLCYLLVLFFIKFVINLNINIFFIPHPATTGMMDVFLQIILFTLFIPWSATTLMVQLKDLELRHLPRFQQNTIQS